MRQRAAVQALALVACAPSPVACRTRGRGVATCSTHGNATATTTTPHTTPRTTAAAAAGASGGGLQSRGAVCDGSVHDRDGRDGAAGALPVGRARGGADDHAEGSTLPAVDELGAWLDASSAGAVAAGQYTTQAASYIKRVVASQPEMRAGMLDVLRQTGSAPLHTLTHYQRKQVTQAMQVHLSSIVSNNVQQHDEETEAMRRHVTEGKPTGKNRWYEAGDVLASSEVPSYVKDDIFDDMRSDRQATATPHCHGDDVDAHAGTTATTRASATTMTTHNVTRRDA